MTIEGQTDSNQQVREFKLHGGDQVTWLCEVAYPPGAPAILKLVTHDGSCVEVTVKCRGSKRLADGRFEVSARTVSLPKTVREKLALAI